MPSYHAVSLYAALVRDKQEMRARHTGEVYSLGLTSVPFWQTHDQSIAGT
jgi:hypothetical protein